MNLPTGPYTPYLYNTELYQKCIRCVSMLSLQYSTLDLVDALELSFTVGLVFIGLTINTWYLQNVARFLASDLPFCSK